MPKAATAEQTPEIHSIANLSPVSPSPVHTTTVSALPALQNQADYFGSDPADQARAIAMAHIQAENARARADVNVRTADEDVGMDDDLYGDVEHDESPQDATESQEHPATEADDEYAKTFDSPTSEEMGGSGEQGSETQRGGPAGTDTGTVEHLNVSSVQSSTGASGPVQPSPAPDASTTTATADIALHASTVPSLAPADIPPSHPSLPAKPDAEDPAVDVEFSKGAHPVPPSEPSLQMPDSAMSPRTDGSNASHSHPPVPLTGQPTVGQVNQANSEPSSSLPQPPSNPTPNGRHILPPASADLPSRPPVDMNRMRDPVKAASRHGGPKSKGGPQAPGVGPSFGSAPGLPRAPGVTESLGALGPPPGPSNPSLPAPPTVPANTSGPPLHYPARPSGGEGRRGDFHSKWEAYQADEKRYTAEQKWDRFPESSRVFIGNLSSDKVTKRDVFDLFHRFGRIAQISLKSAFGFVQYHTYEEAKAAVDSLEGAEVKGRKIHLEFTRTQKKKEGKDERARSPDRGVRGKDAGHGRGGRFDNGPRRSRDDNRYGRYSGDFSPHQRDDSYGRGRGYHPNRPSRDRSFSPRARGRDRGGKDPYRNRSRSPYGRGWAGDEGRGSRAEGRESPPDVQLLLLQEVDPGYVNWVRDVFSERGLRSDAMIVNPTLHIKQDVISRLVVSGVSGIVELDYRGQDRGEVYLHLYDLSGGLSNVRFNEYRDLKPHQAADLVRGRPTPGYQPPSAHAPAPAYGVPAPAAYPPHGQPVLQPAASTYSGAGLGVQPAQPPPTQPAQPANDAANIQQILSQLQQSSQPPAPQIPPQQQNPPVDIQAILGSLTGNASVGASTPVQTPPQNYGYAPVSAPAPAAVQGAAGTGTTDAQVQSIMAQLARFRQ